MKAKLVKVDMRIATAADAHLPAFDNTKLTAINTCPTWGIIRYGLHKTMSGEGRAMALEAGSACHEVFAAVRLWQLNFHDPKNPLSPLHDRDEQANNLFLHHGLRLFGEDRFMLMQEAMACNEPEETRMLRFCLAALETSGFYDDPRDKRRTMSNLEEACIAYIDKWQFQYPIWVRDADDPTSDVGIEVAFDMVITLHFDAGEFDNDGDNDFPVYEKREYRFTGKLDGLQWHGPTDLRIHENKTASRIDDAWQESFEMSSQITGYCLASSTWTGESVRKATVYGLAIPLPKNYDLGGTIRLPVSREDHQSTKWFEWFLHTTLLHDEYIDDVLAAPQYTHSCNRYFRACSFIPLCTAETEEKKLILEEMRVEEWSPLHEGNN
jgi:hypothetical protein